MALPATDDFTNTNNTNLTSHSASWTANNGMLDIQGNALSPDAGGTESCCHWNADTFDDNQYALADITAVTGTASIGISVRCAASANSFYGCYCDSNNGGQIYLYKVVTGSWTQIGDTSVTAALNKELRLEVSSTTLTYYVDSVEVDSQTDSALSSGYAGVASYGDTTSAKLDNWEGGDLGAGTLSVSVTDTATVGESVTVSLPDALTASVTDTATVGESVTVSIQAVTTRTVNVSDAVTVGESVTASLPDALVASVSDTVTVGESVTVAVTRKASVTDSVTVGESVTARVRAPWYNTDTLTITAGSITAGAITDTWADDATKLQLAETTGTPGSDYSFTFYNVPDTVRSVDINGYYDGNPAHDVKIYQWNFTGESWTALTAADQDFPDASSDQDYEFTIFYGADYKQSGELRLRIAHLTAGNITHSLYIDWMQLQSHPIVSVSDAVTVGESVTVSIVSVGTLAASVSDTVTVGESVTLAISTSTISVSDTVTVGESVTVEVQTEGLISTSVSDSVTVTDSASASLALPGVSTSDSVTVGESVTVSVVAVSTRQISVSETVTVGESVTLGALSIPGISVSESVTITEALWATMGAVLTGDWTLVDASVHSWTLVDSEIYSWSMEDTSRV